MGLCSHHALEQGWMMPEYPSFRKFSLKRFWSSLYFQIPSLSFLWWQITMPLPLYVRSRPSTDCFFSYRQSKEKAEFYCLELWSSWVKKIFLEIMINNSWVRKRCQTQKFNIFVCNLSLHILASALKKQAHSEFTLDVGHEVWCLVFQMQKQMTPSPWPVSSPVSSRS